MFIFRIIRSFLYLAMLACVFSVIGQKDAEATLISYTLNLSGNTNTPTVRLTNTSAVPIKITQFNLTIGNTSFNFDSVSNQTPSVSSGIVFTLIRPDTNSSGVVRSDDVLYTFSGFNPTEFFQFGTDLDQDNVNTSEDYRNVFFNNGSAPNSVITVNFSNGAVLSQTIPDALPQSRYSFSQSQTVPEPSTLALLGSGLAVLIGFGRKRLVKRREENSI